LSNRFLGSEELGMGILTWAIKCLNIVIPAKAGIQVGTGCRIKSGMTELVYLVARLITLAKYFPGSDVLTFDN
jgi:hypothetical protein